MATLDTFCRRLFPNFLSLKVMALIRLLVASCAFSLTIHLIRGNGWDVNPNYKPHSKLRRVFIKLRGLGSLCPFTSWCWLFLGLSFALNGLIALAVDLGHSDLIQPWMLRTALCVWELSAPFSLLVSAVIRWSIWPIVVAGGKPHNLGCFRNQMQHNANSILTLTETALLGGIPVIYTHLALSTLVGVIYILFSWFMGAYMYGEKGDGPQYLYWFFDTTLGRTSTIALVALLFALTASFGIFVGVETLIQRLGGNLLTNLAIVVGFSGLVCRFW